MKEEKETKNRNKNQNKEDMRGGSFELKGEQSCGKVSIADEVVAVIAGIAAVETEGVARLSGGITSDLVSKIGLKKLSTGVNILLSTGKVRVRVTLELKYGYKVKEVSQEVQKHVKASIETMTGLEVETVDVHVLTVTIDNN